MQIPTIFCEGSYHFFLGLPPFWDVPPLTSPCPARPGGPPQPRPRPRPGRPRKLPARHRGRQRVLRESVLWEGSKPRSCGPTSATWGEARRGREGVGAARGASGGLSVEVPQDCSQGCARRGRNGSSAKGPSKVLRGLADFYQLAV